MGRPARLKQVRRLHRREVPAALELGPVDDVVVAPGEAADRRVGGEGDGDAGRHRLAGLRREGGRVVVGLVVEVGGGTRGTGEPVDADVCEELVAVDGVLERASAILSRVKDLSQ